MVIQCSSCDTRFKISDDKVKNGPVKVRCSKCKEVFTVQPPEEEQVVAAEAAPELSAQGTPSLDDVDWGSLNSEESTEPTAESDESDDETSIPDFSFGEEEDSSLSTGDEFSLGDNEYDTEDASDEFSFGDDETSVAAESDEGVDDSFSFGGNAEAAADDFGFDEPVGEGAQDEFSFDEAPAATGTADDFDWDGSGGTGADAEDGFSFNENSSSDDSLDFSSLEMAPDEPSTVEVDAVEPQRQESTHSAETARPTSAKGPQKSGAKGRTAVKRRKPKKKSGPLRGILTLLLLLLLTAGGGLYGLKEMGFWSGNIEELQNVDYVTAANTAWEKAMVEVNRLAGNEADIQPVGTITVVEMAGKYSQNSGAGTLFVIDGTIRNDYNSNRSAIAVKGLLYDEAGSVVQQNKVYCGNAIDDNTLQTGTLAEIQELGANVFGDRFSNDDVPPGKTIPFTIVFSDLPDNLAKFNVEIVESVSGSKK